MAHIWMSLESVPTDQFVSMVVAPMIKALGAHGVHANLEPTRNSISQNEGDLAYALFPGGELSFVFTTGPTFNPISGGTHNDRYMMATVTEVPANLGITDTDINQALSDFQTGLLERGIYDARPQLTEGSSIGAQVRVTASSGSAGSASTSTAPTTTPPADNRSSKSGCYVATAVYGGYDVPQVRVLRRFRDQVLSRCGLGRAAIKRYYAVSPRVVRQVGDAAWFGAIARPVLDVFASSLRHSGLSDQPYDDPRW